MYFSNKFTFSGLGASDSSVNTALTLFSYDTHFSITTYCSHNMLQHVLLLPHQLDVWVIKCSPQQGKNSLILQMPSVKIF